MAKRKMQSLTKRCPFLYPAECRLDYRDNTTLSDLHGLNIQVVGFSCAFASECSRAKDCESYLRSMLQGRF